MRNLLIAVVATIACSSSFAAQAPKTDAKSVYTLYRSSSVNGGETWRIHVATFDAIDGAEYNRDNCEIAKGLFQSQTGVTVTYWCERGYFTKQ